MSDAVLTAFIGAAAVIVVEWIRRGPAATLLATVLRLERKLDALAKFQGLDFRQEADRVIVLRRQSAAASQHSTEAERAK